ncbi:MAG: hypothetical protein R3A78_10455 [Polyangiales bacterium]|nr:hypothetical protein [Myxococcales bacterium]
MQASGVRAVHLALALSVASLAVVPAVFAQESKVLDLNRAAMEDYQNLDMDGAVDKLVRAAELAKSSNVSRSLLATSYLNLGVVYVAGFADNGRGLDAFVRALEADPSAKLDPLTSTPEVQTVYNLAKKKAGSGGGEVDGNIPHTAPSGQVIHTPLPVFVEVPGKAPVQKVTLFYRHAGDDDYEKARMERMEGGFGYEIPCAAVAPPSVEYFFVAYDRRGKALGFRGKSDAPISVPVVAALAGPAPSLPGREPPAACADLECPPGMPGCSTPPATGGPIVEGHLEGEACEQTLECAAGLECFDGTCQPEEPEDTGNPPRFFLHLGGTFGVAYVGEGMPADSAPVGSGTSTTHVQSGQAGCSLDNPNEYCVRIQTPGFVPTFALRVTAGYYIFERLALAGTWRFQPSAGEGAMANMLLGLRAQYLFTTPREEGLGLAGFVGGSYGQIQPQPAQPTSDKAPYVRAGLGGVQLGGVVVYRFSRNFGLHFTPEVHMLLPLFLFNLDFTAGVEIGF